MSTLFCLSFDIERYLDSMVPYLVNNNLPLNVGKEYEIKEYWAEVK